MLTAAQTAEVKAYIDSPENRAWERAISLKWAKKRGELSPLERYFAAQKERRTVTTNAISAKRHAAKLKRTPPWADQKAIMGIYRKARSLTVSTGIEHHVDHVYPLQGRLVSGLHVHTNMQILSGSENIRKSNIFEVIV